MLCYTIRVWVLYYNTYTILIHIYKKMDLFNIEEEHIVFNKSIENLINSHKQVVGKLLERIDYLHNQNKELLLKNKELAESETASII